MAIFVFGSDGDALGRLGDLRCPFRNEKRPFNAAARYNYFQAGMLGVAGLVCANVGGSTRPHVSSPDPVTCRFGKWKRHGCNSAHTS